MEKGEKYNSSARKFVQGEDQHSLELLEPLLKIMKDRETLYFEALGFVSKNIESCSDDLEQILIFSKFLNTNAELESKIIERETVLFDQIGPSDDPPSEGLKSPTNSKELVRIFARVTEILDTSMQKTRNSIFFEGGRLSVDFENIKSALNGLMKHKICDIYELISILINFMRQKYRKQMARIKDYLNQLQAGENIFLKDLFSTGTNQILQEEKQIRLSKSFRANRKFFKESASEESPTSTKRNSARKMIPSSSRGKRAIYLKEVKKEEQDTKEVTEQEETKLQKATTAVCLLKYYSIMEMNKKDFLEDFVFEKQDLEKQKKKLISKLMEKNNKNSDQISVYHEICENNKSYIENLHHFEDHKFDFQREDSSINSKISMRTSFVISKRASFMMDFGSDRSDNEKETVKKLSLSRTFRNFSQLKKSDEKKTSKPKQGGSKRLFILKTPVTFNEETIPKISTTDLNMMQTALRPKEKKKRNEPIRLKKRNNPMPLNEKYLPESFRFNECPI